MAQADSIVVLFLAFYLLFFSNASFASINDPTRPIYSENATSSIVTTREVTESKLIHLQSIFISEKRKVAVLNGEVVKEGVVSNEVSVIAIEPDHIVVEYKDQQLHVKLFSKVYIDKTTGDIRE
jgi:P pilus assembly chaperone PapD